MHTKAELVEKAVKRLDKEVARLEREVLAAKNAPDDPVPDRVHTNSYPAGVEATFCYEVESLKDVDPIFSKVGYIGLVMRKGIFTSFVPEELVDSDKKNDDEITQINPITYRFSPPHNSHSPRAILPTTCLAEWFFRKNGFIFEINVSVTRPEMRIVPNHEMRGTTSIATDGSFTSQKTS